LIGEINMPLVRQLVEDVKDAGFNPQFGIIFKTQMLHSQAVSQL